MDTHDLKEKLVLLGFTAAVFLPLRIFFSQYVSDHWLGNLGIATLVSVTMIILVKKNRLGMLGVAFKNQMSKALWGRSAKFIIAAVVFFMFYFGTTILLIDRGNTVYLQDKEVLYEHMSGSALDKTVLVSLSGPQMQSIAGIAHLQYVEYLFSISYAMLNDTTNGWLVNLHSILFIEQIEVLGLLWFYKKMFRPVQTVSV
jgi:hypothetical protein